MNFGELVTCPGCKLMAHHPHELHTPKPRTDVEIYVWNSTEPVQPQPFYRLQCLFCDHRWSEHAADDTSRRKP